MTDPAFVEWLQVPERLVTVDDAPATAKWGDLAVAQSASSSLVNEANATAECSRQLAFKGGPLVEEQVVVPKRLDVAAVRGRVQTVTIPGDPIYGAGVNVFVFGGAVENSTGLTRLDVLRRL
jgi:hypothetical protein